MINEMLWIQQRFVTINVANKLTFTVSWSSHKKQNFCGVLVGLVYYSCGLGRVRTAKCSQNNTEPLQHAEKDKRQVLKRPLAAAAWCLHWHLWWRAAVRLQISTWTSHWVVQTFISRAGVWSLSHTRVLSRPAVLPPLFLSLCLILSVFLSASVSAPPHMRLNVTSRWPPGSQSDGRSSCMELLEPHARRATWVMEVSRNHRGSEANGNVSLQKDCSFPLSKVNSCNMWCHTQSAARGGIYQMIPVLSA